MELYSALQKMKFCCLQVNGWNWRTWYWLVKIRKTKATCYLSYVENRSNTNISIIMFICKYTQNMFPKVELLEETKEGEKKRKEWQKVNNNEIHQKINIIARWQWLMPVILATQEAEIRSIMVWSSPRQKVWETLTQKPSQKMAGRVARSVEPTFKLQ
jgi:hypothetical protein